MLEDILEDSLFNEYYEYEYGVGHILCDIN